MNQTQKQLIEEQMKRIPAEVREAISASDWERTVFNIGRAHKLHIDDIDVLSVETILTMIGLEHPKDFNENLQKRTGIKNDTLYEIVDEINERLFSKIRRALQEHYEKVATGEIMAMDEKDELHYAGIELDDHAPPPPKKPKQEPVAQDAEPDAPVEESVEKPKVVFTFKNTESTSPESEGVQTKQEKKYPSFDPYREPLE